MVLLCCRLVALVTPAWPRESRAAWDGADTPVARVLWPPQPINLTRSPSLLLVCPRSCHKAGQEIPFDETHLHYGKAQTGAEIALAPGRHRLTLQFANAAHKSYGPGYAASITVNVRK